MTKGDQLQDSATLFEALGTGVSGTRVLVAEPPDEETVTAALCIELYGLGTGKARIRFAVPADSELMPYLDPSPGSAIGWRKFADEIEQILEKAVSIETSRRWKQPPPEPGERPGPSTEEAGRDTPRPRGSPPAVQGSARATTGRARTDFASDV
jgi:hypothetical protein